MANAKLSLLFLLAELFFEASANCDASTTPKPPPSTFGCVNSQLTDEYRNFYLNYHNNARRRLAKGLEPNKTGLLPPGKNIYQLNWDCAIEEIAQKWANQCQSAYQKIDSSLAQSYRYYDNADPMFLSKHALDLWWSVVSTYGQTDPQNRYMNGNLYAWANMAHGRSTGLGCAYAKCGTYVFLTCLYSDIPYYGKAPIYEKGPTCTSAAQCTTHPNSQCKDGLCYIPPSGPLVETFNMCPGVSDMSDQSRMMFLNTHNRLRSSLAKGLEPDGIAPGAFAPKAKQMTKMRYNCTVEHYARQWGNTCSMPNHSPASQRPGMGETLYYWDTEYYNKIKIGETASFWFWDELKYVGLGNPVFTQNMTSRGEIRHYTQMAWEKSTDLGCHVRVCPGMTAVVCQYYPAGNMWPNLIYVVGDPCTKNADCPGTQTCSVAESLCIVH